MSIKFKSDLGWIAGMAILFFVLSYYSHKPQDRERFEKAPITGVQQQVSESVETIPKYHRMGWGESLSDIVCRYYPCKTQEDVEYKIEQIQKLNWDEREIDRRDIYEVVDGKLVSGQDGLADIVYFLETIKIRE